MAVSPGKSSVRVTFRHPEMVRNLSFNAASSFLVWVLRHQAGVAIRNPERHVRKASHCGSKQHVQSTVHQVHKHY